MAVSVPTVRQTSWISVIPHFIIMFLIVGIFYFLNISDFVMKGLLTYLSLSFALKYFVPKSHREGMKLTKLNQYEDAITKYENSYNFFTKNLWIDKYRFITLLSASKNSYREMALCNIAFCYSQIGKGHIATEYYRKTLNEFPENGMAIAGLKMINSTNENK